MPISESIAAVQPSNADVLLQAGVTLELKPGTSTQCRGVDPKGRTVLREGLATDSELELPIEKLALWSLRKANTG